MFKKIFYSSSFVLIVAVAFGYYQQFRFTQTVIDIEKWGQENLLVLSKIKTLVKPFKIEYDEAEFEALKRKLENTRYFEPLDGENVKKFEFGFDSEYLKELVDYWKMNYNWSKQVENLNRFPQFRININEITIHYVRVVTNEAPGRKPIPILLIDGWPGAFFGFYKMIDYMNENYKDLSFDIIVPSIPGYGYSTPLKKPFDFIDTAQYFDALMRFVHNENVQYFIHGEDWGSIIATALAQLYPNRCKAIHISMALPGNSNDLIALAYQITGAFVPSLVFSPEEIRLGVPAKFSIKNIAITILKEMGYMHIQATKPDTVAQGLTDSPSGLLAYILEKYSSWSFDFNSQIAGKRDGGLESFNRDDLLTIITYYWMTNSISSSVRFYKGWADIYSKQNSIYTEIVDSKVPISVFVGVQYGVNEVLLTPAKIVQLRYQNLIQFKVIDKCGHFAAFEQPKITSTNFVEFIKSSMTN